MSNDKPLSELLDEIEEYFDWRVSDGDKNGLHHEIPHAAIKAIHQLSKAVRQRLEQEQEVSC